MFYCHGKARLSIFGEFSIWSLICTVVLSSISCIAIILLTERERDREREREREIQLCSCCRVGVCVLCLVLVVPLVGLWSLDVPCLGL